MAKAKDRSLEAVARAHMAKWPCHAGGRDFRSCDKCGTALEALVRSVRRECAREAVADLTGSGVIRTQYARQMVLARLAALNRAPRRGR